MSTQTHTIAGAYEIDAAHSRIGFVARHAMVSKVRGSFNEFDGSGFFDPDDLSRSWLLLTIQAESIDTRNQDRDEHLRSNDFFAMGHYPTIEFVSTAITETSRDEYRVVGDLTMRGVTHAVDVDFEYSGKSLDPDGQSRIGFEGKATVNRKAWGVSWNEALDAGGVLIGDQVTLEFDVSAIQIDN